MLISNLTSFPDEPDMIQGSIAILLDFTELELLFLWPLWLQQSRFSWSDRNLHDSYNKGNITDLELAIVKNRVELWSRKNTLCNGIQYNTTYFQVWCRKHYIHFVAILCDLLCWEREQVACEKSNFIFSTNDECYSPIDSICQGHAIGRS